MTIIFDEVQATIEPPTGPNPSVPASPPLPPAPPLDVQLRLLHERQVRLVAD